MVERKTFTVPAQSWAAGTVGTRAVQVTVADVAVSGAEVVDVTLLGPASTVSYIPIAFLSGSNVLVNFYRANAAAYKNTTYPQEATVVVTYARKAA